MALYRQATIAISLQIINPKSGLNAPGTRKTVIGVLEIIIRQKLLH